MSLEKKLPDSEALKLEIWELIRLELAYEQDIKKLQADLEKLRNQRELLETQLRLIKDGKLGQDDERID